MTFLSIQRYLITEYGSETSGSGPLQNFAFWPLRIGSVMGLGWMSCQTWCFDAPQPLSIICYHLEGFGALTQNVEELWTRFLAVSRKCISLRPVSNRRSIERSLNQPRFKHACRLKEALRQLESDIHCDFITVIEPILVDFETSGWILIFSTFRIDDVIISDYERETDFLANKSTSLDSDPLFTLTFCIYF